MVSATELFNVPFGPESKKEISKLIGDIFQKCGAKEAKVRGFFDNYNYFKNHSDVS